MTKGKWCFFYHWIRSDFLARLALGGTTWIPNVLGILNAIFDQKYTNSGRATHLATNIKGYDLKVIRKDPKILAKKKKLQKLHPWKRTWNPKMKVWKMIHLLKWVIVRFVLCQVRGRFPPSVQVFLYSKPGDLGGAVTLGEPLVSKFRLSEPWESSNYGNCIWYMHIECRIYTWSNWVNNPNFGKK